MERFDTNCHGEYDFLHNLMMGYFSEWGEGSKDTNLTLDQIFMTILARKRAGNKVLVLVSDCGGHQQNQYMVGFAQLLVDHGFFSVVLLVYFDQLHSKGPSDQQFAGWTALWKYEDLFSVDDLARSIGKMPDGAAQDDRNRGVIPNGLAMCEWTESIMARYFPCMRMSQNGGDNIHVVALGLLDDIPEIEVSVFSSSGERRTVRIRHVMTCGQHALMTAASGLAIEWL